MFMLWKFSLKVAVGPKRSTNRNLKQIITTKTVIFHLLRPPDISKFAKIELIQWIYFLTEAITLVLIQLEIVTKRLVINFSKLIAIQNGFSGHYISTHTEAGFSLLFL